MLKTLKLQNFTVFKEARLKFSPGLNIIIGENGTGKSHLLKLGYALQTIMNNFREGRVSEKLNPILSSNIIHAFNYIYSMYGSMLVYKFSNNVFPHFFAEFFSREYIGFDLFNLEKTFRYNGEEGKTDSILFIPTKEILSIYKGFRSTLKNRELAFDGTYLDLAEALDLPPFKGDRLADVRPLFEPLEKILHARVEQENGEFFFAAQGADEEKTGNRIHAQLAAEGHRKLGMLSYLIKNGSLRKGTSLFWDEPEANLNPRLLAKLAVILVELSKIMQVTIATHSLFLLRELEILQEKQQLRDARYFGLHFAEDGGVEIQQGDNSNDIGDIAALDANVEQSTRYLQMDEDF